MCLPQDVERPEALSCPSRKRYESCRTLSDSLAFVPRVDPCEQDRPHLRGISFRLDSIPNARKRIKFETNFCQINPDSPNALVPGICSGFSLCIKCLPSSRQGKRSRAGKSQAYKIRENR